MVMGALAPTLARKTTLLIPLFVVASSLMVMMAFGSVESDSLMKFKDGLKNNTGLSSWNPSVNPCDWNRANWFGVLCLNGTIWGLKLERMDLAGTVDVDSLVSLSNFRTLSLMDNRFEGPLPDVKKLGKLKALYLSNNFFSGDIADDAFQGMGSLKRVFMANNLFTGTIPASLVSLPKLMELRLEGNQFQGQIPNFQNHSLKTANFASNELVGPIPANLSRMSPQSFSGNKGLCGAPLEACPLAPASATTGALKPMSEAVKIVLIVMVVVVAVGVVGMGLVVLYRKRQREELGRTASSSINSNKIASSYGSGERAESEAGGDQSMGMRRAENKLAFMREDVEKFDLNDLLRASAEVLGSGTFGSSYKACVNGGQAMVVKRYRHMNNVGREEFHEHMRRLGRLKHPNLLSLAAYYYRKEEKLLVYQYVENGSLASHLHGNRSSQRQGLDWNTRLKIIKGIVRGLSYLYSELPMVVPHGHLKSSNVLLGPSMEALLTDYALRPVINPQKAHNLMIAYKSPEYTQQGRTSNKTDIFNLGILILEILTGKFPENYLLPTYDSSISLATWVNNMVKERRINEVFDKDMKGAKDNKADMFTMLKIGLSCCDEDVETRFDINQVLQKIQDLEDHTGTHNPQVSRPNSLIRRNDDYFSFSVDR